MVDSNSRYYEEQQLPVRQHIGLEVNHTGLFTCRTESEDPVTDTLNNCLQHTGQLESLTAHFTKSETAYKLFPIHICVLYMSRGMRNVVCSPTIINE